MIEFVKPTSSDLKYLADNLRDEDKLEVATVKPGADLLDTLKECAALSDKSFVVRKDGVPAVIFGSRGTEDVIAGVGAKASDIWLLGTDAVKLNRISFLKLSKKVVSEFAQDCDYLWNIVDPRNELHVRWLQWLGFTFPSTYKVNDEIDFLVAVRYS